MKNPPTCRGLPFAFPEHPDEAGGFQMFLLTVLLQTSLSNSICFLFYHQFVFLTILFWRFATILCNKGKKVKSHCFGFQAAAAGKLCRHTAKARQWCFNSLNKAASRLLHQLMQDVERIHPRGGRVPEPGVLTRLKMELGRCSPIREGGPWTPHPLFG